MSSDLLGNHVDILSGFAFCSDNFNEEQGMPVVRIRDVVRGSSETRFQGDFNHAFLVQNGDMLVGMDGQFNVGTWRGGEALLNQRVCRVKARETLSERYLYHLLPSALRKIEDSTPFVTVKHLSVRDIRSIKLEVPPLEEQRRIAAILDQAEALQAKRRQALAKLDTLTQSLFLDMFGDPRVENSHWPKVKFGSVAECKLGKMLDKGQHRGRSKMFPYLRNANVQWNHVDTSSLLQMEFSEDDQGRFELNPGDLLMCEGGQPGRCAIWGGEISGCFYQKALHRCRVDCSKGVGKFFVFLFWELSRRKALISSASTIGHLTAEKLDEMWVILPPLELQKEFAKITAAAESCSSAASEHLEGLGQITHSLQNRAFRGEL